VQVPHIIIIIISLIIILLLLSYYYAALIITESLLLRNSYYYFLIIIRERLATIFIYAFSAISFCRCILAAMQNAGLDLDLCNAHSFASTSAKNATVTALRSVKQRNTCFTCLYLRAVFSLDSHNLRATNRLNYVIGVRHDCATRQTRHPERQSYLGTLLCRPAPLKSDLNTYCLMRAGIHARHASCLANACNAHAFFLLHPIACRAIQRMRPSPHRPKPFAG
jgi:hypothetical protein